MLKQVADGISACWVTGATTAAPNMSSWSRMTPVMQRSLKWLEFGIYAVVRLEFAELFPQQESEVRKQLIEAKIFLAYQRQLNNLSIQESRLRRQREKDMAALREHQKTRKRDQANQLYKAALQYIRAVREDRHEDWEPAANGFELPIEQIEVRALEIDPDLFAAWAAENAA